MTYWNTFDEISVYNGLEFYFRKSQAHQIQVFKKNGAIIQTYSLWMLKSQA